MSSVPSTIAFNRQENQRLLQSLGFTGQAGGGAGEKFLDTLSADKQQKYVNQRAEFQGESGYSRGSIVANAKPIRDALSPIFNDLTGSPSTGGKMWSREVNQSLLSRFGFTGQAGPQYGGQGEKFLDTLPLAKQFEYTQSRRGYTGEQSYTRSTLRELENNLFQQFFNPTPTKNSTNNAITDTAVTQAARKGRKSTIVSDFESLETPQNVQRKTLLGA